MFIRLHPVAASVLVMLVTSADLFAAGGTSIVATKGRPVKAPDHWPEGVSEPVNDSARTTGWNSWFTELAQRRQPLRV